MPPNPVPILYAAAPWRPPLSEYVTLWHGCTALAKTDIEANGIEVAKCAVDTDFGRGFYTTTVERQARLWAWEQYYRWRNANPRGPADQPVILRFRVRRYSVLPRHSALDDGLDSLKSLAFVRGDFDNEDYWSLVQHCRQSPSEPPNDHRHPGGGWYHLVSGPVSAFWRQRVAMDGADQFSFYEDGVELLNAVLDAGTGRGQGNQRDPAYYSWLTVT